MKIGDFRQGTPPLVLEDYFAGRTEGWGYATDRSSNVEKQFSIEANGAMHPDGSFGLIETYRFDDGSTDQLEWSIRRTDPHHYTGTEPRMDGQAQGEQEGNAFHWRYRRRTSMSRLALDFDDWFLLQPDGVLLASATFGRLGLVFGRMSVCYRKPSPAATLQAPRLVEKA